MNKDPQGGYKMGTSMNDRMSHKKAKLNAGYNPISNTILPGWRPLMLNLILIQDQVLNNSHLIILFILFYTIL